MLSMHKLPVIGGRRVAHILIKKFQFVFISQKGSHIKLSGFIGGLKHTTIVPDHKTLAPGTLRGVLKMSGISLDEFIAAL